MAKLSQQKSTTTIHATTTVGATTATTTPTVLKAKRTRKTVPRDSPPQRSSIYRGVTRHRWTGRYEAHLWDKNCWNESQNKKGRQLFAGAYDDEEAAAHAYDLAALKYWGHETILNFPLATYEKELKLMEGQSREEYIGSLRRKSSGFSRGVSKYRGVARHHHNGRWEARIGRVFGNKYLYLGTYATQEEAAVAYDMAAIEYRGLNAVTNFDLSRYIKWLRPNNNNNTNNEVNPIIGTNLVPTQNHSLCSNSNSNSSSSLSGSSGLYNHHQQPLLGRDEQKNHTVTTTDVSLAQSQPTSTTSALGLLFQSTKFKEMMEMTLAAECSAPAIVEANIPPRRSFPEDIKTCFEDQDFASYGDDMTTFDNFNSLMQPILQLDFDF
nr:AP2-like ethylene-responsive transcription factor At1g16060 [Ipomoea batatas]